MSSASAQNPSPETDLLDGKMPSTILPFDFSSMDIPVAPVSKEQEISLEERATIRGHVTDMQQAFLLWQKSVQQKPTDAVLSLESDYATWFSQQKDVFLRDIPAAQRGPCLELLHRQGHVYADWVRRYVAKQRYVHAVQTQEAVLASNAQMLLANIEDAPLTTQALEQIMAASQELGRLQGVSQEEARRMEEVYLAQALRPALERVISAGDVDAALHAFAEHGILLDAESAGSLVQRLREKQEQKHIEHAIATLAHEDAAVARNKAQNARWLRSMHLSKDAGVLVAQAVRAHTAQQQTHGKAQKEERMRAYYADIVHTTLGLHGNDKDPYLAMRFVQQAPEDIIGKKDKTSMIMIISEGKMDMHDDYETVIALQDALVTEKEGVRRSKLLQAIAWGKLRYETALTLRSLHERCSQAQKLRLQGALKALDRALLSVTTGKNDSTAHEASMLAARYAARTTYLDDILASLTGKEAHIPLQQTSATYLTSLAEDFFPLLSS